MVRVVTALKKPVIIIVIMNVERANDNKNIIIYIKKTYRRFPNPKVLLPQPQGHIPFKSTASTPRDRISRNLDYWDPEYI
jgi:hypothetical protein